MLNNQYEKIINAIRDEMISSKHDYRKALVMCKEFIHLLYKNNNKDNDNYWIGYFDLAYNYKKLGNFNEAIKYGLKAIQYTEQDRYDYKYASPLSLLANCYEELGIEQEAINLYKKCAELYRLVNMPNYQIASLFSIANIEKDIEQMKKLIIEYENALTIDSNKVYKDREQKINTLNDMKNVLAQYM